MVEAHISPPKYSSGIPARCSMALNDGVIGTGHFCDTIMYRFLLSTYDSFLLIEHSGR